jgi:hypothetical protein
MKDHREKKLKDFYKNLSSLEEYKQSNGETRY